MTFLRIDQLGSMGPLEENSFWENFEKVLAADDGAAAKEHLAAGRAITYRDPQCSGALVREWPDGRRELIKADKDGNVTVLKTI